MYVSRNEKREGKSQKRVNKSYLIFTVQELLMIPGGDFGFFSEKLPINIRKLDNTVKHVSRCALYEIFGEKESFENRPEK